MLTSRFEIKPEQLTMEKILGSSGISIQDFRGESRTTLTTMLPNIGVPEI